MDNANQTVQWLLESDPSIRWQVMEYILHASQEEAAIEREKVGIEGWGAAILANQSENGTWGQYSRFPEMVTLRTLYLLCDMGLDPGGEPAKHAIALVRDNVRWLMNIGREELPKDKDISWWQNPFFVGEVEPCINGRVLRVGAYFGQDMQPLVDRLLGEQMQDGGWNCEQETGSSRGSFHTTINVLEGLLEFELATGNTSAVEAARERGQEYLLKRHLFKRLSTGEPIREGLKDSHDWTQFSYPAGWRYDILRGLDYLRKAGVARDPRLDEAIDLVKSKSQEMNRWYLDIVYPEEPIAEPETVVGKPSYWNTLRALRVLEWYSTPNSTAY